MPLTDPLFSRGDACAQAETTFEIITYEEMVQRLEAEQAFQATLKPSDPRHEDMFCFDDYLGYVDLYWGGYEYSYRLNQISSPTEFLGFLAHVAEKRWEHSTAHRVSNLIRQHSHRMRWDLNRPAPSAISAPVSRQTSDSEERGKLTRELRYSVLLRDDFRCRACGFDVASGAHLHIDHIIPISKNGLTIYDNLQSLCSACNLGKGSKL